MFKKIKEFFVGKPVEVTPAPVPYKVEIAPVESSAASMKEELKNPMVVALEQTQEAAIPLVVETAPEPEKKVRKIRTPKTETAVKEKAPAKAKAPKLTVIKATKSKKV